MDLTSLLLAIGGGGVVASVVTEILKHPLVPIAFEKFPRVTAYVLSVLASLLVLVNQGYTYEAVTYNLTTILSTGSLAFLISVVAYNQVVKKDTSKNATRF